MSFSFSRRSAAARSRSNIGELIGQEAMQSGTLGVQNGWYMQWNIPGAINGVEGAFEYGGTLSPLGNAVYVTHTFFAF